MREWWDKNAETAFPDGDGPPTFEETKKHAKGRHMGVRTKDAIKIYFRGYRLRCKVSGSRATVKRRSAKGAAKAASRQAASGSPGSPQRSQSDGEEGASLAASRRPTRARAKPKRLQSPGPDTSDTSVSSIDTGSDDTDGDDSSRGAARTEPAHYFGAPGGPAFDAAQGGGGAAADSVTGLPSGPTRGGMDADTRLPGEPPSGFDAAPHMAVVSRFAGPAAVRSPRLPRSRRPQEAADAREQGDDRQPTPRQLRSPPEAPESRGPLKTRLGQRAGRRSLQQLPQGEPLEDSGLEAGGVCQELADAPLGLLLERAPSQRDQDARTAAELLLQRIRGVPDVALKLPPPLPPSPAPAAAPPLPRSALAPMCVNSTITTATNSSNNNCLGDNATDAYAALRSFPMRHDNMLSSLTGQGSIFSYGTCHISSAIPPTSATAAARNLPYEPRKTPAKRLCAQIKAEGTVGLSVQVPAAGEVGGLSRGNSLQLQLYDRGGPTSRGAGRGDGKAPTPGPGHSKPSDPLWEVDAFSPSLLLALGAKPPDSVLRLTGVFGAAEGVAAAAAAAGAWIPGRTPHTLLRSRKVLQEELERSTSLDATGLEWLAGLPLGDSAGLEQILADHVHNSKAAKEASPRPAERSDGAEQPHDASLAYLRHQVKQEPVEMCTGRGPAWVPMAGADRQPQAAWPPQQQQPPVHPGRDYGPHYGAAQYGQYGMGLGADPALSDMYGLAPPHDYYFGRRPGVQQAAEMRMPPPAGQGHYGPGAFGPHMGMFPARGTMRTEGAQQRLPPLFYPQQPTQPPAFLPANAGAPARGYPAEPGGFGGFPQLGLSFVPDGRGFPAGPR